MTTPTPDIGSGRPLRVCDVCGGIDDHPRVRHMYPTGYAPAVPAQLIIEVSQRVDISDDVKREAIEELTDPGSLCRHMDCCRDAGCPNGVCGQVLETAQANGATGNELLNKLQTDEVSNIGHVFNEAEMVKGNVDVEDLL